jgi:hypothetical protein
MRSTSESIIVALVASAMASPAVLARPPGFSSPPAESVTLDTGSFKPIDAQVAAGRDYVMVADAGHVKAYTKSGESVQMPSVPEIFARLSRQMILPTRDRKTSTLISLKMNATRAKSASPV